MKKLEAADLHEDDEIDPNELTFQQEYKNS